MQCASQARFGIYSQKFLKECPKFFPIHNTVAIENFFWGGEGVGVCVKLENGNIFSKTKIFPFFLGQCF
jgi:hypothetical protein